jgi:hypothetical protein
MRVLLLGLGALLIATTGATAGGVGKFKNFEKVPAEILAETGAKLLNDALPDFATARFQGVHALILKAKDKFGAMQDVFIICGEVNSKNRFGGYGGWTDFAVSGFDGWTAPPTLMLGDQLSGLMIEPLCGHDEEQHARRDDSPTYGRLVAGRKATARAAAD